MKNINTQNYESTQSETVEYKNTINNTKESVKSTLDAQATIELAKIFNLNKEQITKLTSTETMKVADLMDANLTTLELADKFNKKNEMIALNNRGFSLASVMNDYDEYEAKVA